jgi:hypothetical protein
MAEVGQADIRGLDIDRLAKGFARPSYIFKSECTVAPMKGDSIRWFQKTAGVLTPTAPSVIASVSPGSIPETLEVSWTRNVSYPKPYKVEGFLTMEDIRQSEVDVLATTIRDLTEAIANAVDADIWDVMSESQSPTNIQTFATTSIGGAQWNSGTNGEIVKDLMYVKKLVKDFDYPTEGMTLFLDSIGYQSLVNWLISVKGSSIPGFSSEKIKSGIVTNILGFNVKVSNNVTADYALAVVPKKATTVRQAMQITAKKIDKPLIGTTVRIGEEMVAYNTDPKAIVLISDLSY